MKHPYFPKTRFGRKSTSDGIRTKKIRLSSSTPIKGISGGVTCAIETRASPQAVNRTVPAGGDTCAIAMLMVKTMAKCVGSMPNCIAMGRKIGTVIRIVGVGSRNVPIASRKRFISRNTVSALLVLPSRYDENISGTRSSVMTQLKANDVKIRNITSPVMTLVWTAEPAPLPVELAIHERADERRIHHGNRAGFRGREDATDDAGDDDGRGDAGNDRLAERAQQPADREGLGELDLLAHCVEVAVDAQHQSGDHTRDQARQQQVGDGDVRRQRKDDQGDARRHQHAQRARGRDQRRGERAVVALLDHRRNDGGPDRRRVGDGGAGNPAEQHRRHHACLRQRTAEMTDQRMRQLDQARCDATAIHEIARRDEQRDGKQREGIDGRDHALRGGHQVVAGHQHGDHRSAEQRKGDRDVNEQQQQKRAHQDGGDHWTCLSLLVRQRSDVARRNGPGSGGVELVFGALRFLPKLRPSAQPIDDLIDDHHAPSRTDTIGSAAYTYVDRQVDRRRSLMVQQVDELDAVPHEHARALPAQRGR